MTDPPPPTPLSYAPPPARRGYGAALARALGTVVITSVVLGIGGGILGLLIGLVAPEYYRAVFRTDDPGFDPAAVGGALGLAQGAGLGVLAGAGLAFVLAWRETRLPADPPTAREAPSR